MKLRETGTGLPPPSSRQDLIVENGWDVPIQGTFTQWESVPLLVEVSGIMLKEQKLTEKELRGYRQWLSELDEESRGEQGTSRQAMDPDLWRIFDPKGNIGRQIYESYTDEALLEAVVVTMDHRGISLGHISSVHSPGLFEAAVWKHQ